MVIWICQVVGMEAVLCEVSASERRCMNDFFLQHLPLPITGLSHDAALLATIGDMMCEISNYFAKYLTNLFLYLANLSKHT